MMTTRKSRRSRPFSRVLSIFHGAWHSVLVDSQEAQEYGAEQERGADIVLPVGVGLLLCQAIPLQYGCGGKQQDGGRQRPNGPADFVLPQKGSDDRIEDPDEQEVPYQMHMGILFP